ncbi:MAG: transposase [Phycisphaerae bacterium]|jgi:putative transposase|nr:transposase [Phycisphaerae bacterium]
MPNYVRWRREGASYFFTVVTHRRRRVFDTPLARRLLRQAITETRNRWPFDVFAMVLLPDHLHCLWTLPRDDDRFPARWGHIKKTFTQQYIAAGGKPLSVSKNRARHREQGIWQQRYWEHRIRDEADWYRHRDYIHLNPVKHGYVSEPQAWPWSSIHRHIQLGWLDPNWPGSSPIEIPDVLGE